MATSRFNIIDEGELEVTPNSTRWLVKGMITSITADSANDQEIIWRAVEACTAAGRPLNSALPGHPELLLQRIVARGFVNDGCYVYLYYEIPNFGGTPVSALLVRDRQSMTSRQDNGIVDASGHRVPIVVDGGTFDTFPATIAAGQIQVLSDLATINYLAPCRVIEVSGLTYGAPMNTGQAVFGRVNSDHWQGLNPGYWLCTENETDISKYQSYYTFSLAACSRVITDWSEISYLRSELTGKYLIIPQGDVDSLNSALYINGLTKVPGGTKSGPYPMTSFTGAFGVF